MTWITKTKHIEKGIFYYINNISPLPFTDFFSIDSVDILFNQLKGHKPISYTVMDYMDNGEITEDTIIKLANLCYTMFFKKWDNIYKIFVYEYPILQNYSETITETITNERITNGENNILVNTNILNSVSGYNNGELVNDNKNETQENNQSTNNNQETGQQTKTYTKTGFNGNYIQELNQSIDYLKNDFLFDIIFNDVSKILMLSIYK